MTTKVQAPALKKPKDSSSALTTSPVASQTHSKEYSLFGISIGLLIRAINGGSLQGSQHFLDCIKTLYLLLYRNNVLKIDPCWL